MPSQKSNNAPITVPVAPNNNNNNINNNLKIGELDTIDSRQLSPITTVKMTFHKSGHDSLAMCPTKQFTSFCDVVFFRSLSAFDDFFVFTPEKARRTKFVDSSRCGLPKWITESSYRSLTPRSHFLSFLLNTEKFGNSSSCRAA